MQVFVYVCQPYFIKKTFCFHVAPCISKRRGRHVILPLVATVVTPVLIGRLVCGRTSATDLIQALRWCCCYLEASSPEYDGNGLTPVPYIFCDLYVA